MPNYEPWSADRTAQIIAEHRGLEGPLLPILHALQETFGYIDQAAEPMIAEALNMSAETVLMQAGLLGGHDEGDADSGRITAQVTALIWADNRLSESQKAALLAVYDSMLQK